MKREWIAANPERHKAIKSAWSKANPEGQAKRSRAWYLANKEKADAASKAWIEDNRGRVNARAMRHQAEKFQRTPPWADLGLIDDIYTLASIYRDAGHDVHVDHGIPLRGKRVTGLHTHDNLQILPASVNRSKSNHFHVF